MTKKYKAGDILATKDGQKYSNAIVISDDGDETVVLTDFGNTLTKETWEIAMHWEISKNYLDAHDMDYPLPTIDERAQEQIDLLTEFLKGGPHGG